MRRWATITAAGWVAFTGCRQDAALVQPEATSAEQNASIVRTFAPADQATASMLVFFADVIVSGPGLSTLGPGSVGKFDFPLRHTPGTNLAWASAVQVDRRGYFATAAHAVGPDPILVRSPIPDGGGVRPGRVVYRGTGTFDFAILYAPGPELPEIGWVSTRSLVVGTPLVGAGMGSPSDVPHPGFQVQAYAGRLVAVDPQTGPDGPYLRLLGTLPGHHGDSGGPQFTFPAVGQERGLAGITVGALWTDGAGWQAYAIRPDLDWLRRVIDNDQRMLAAVGPTTRP